MKKVIKLSLAALFTIGIVNTATAQCDFQWQSPGTHTTGKCISPLWTPGYQGDDYCDTTVEMPAGGPYTCYEPIFPE